MAQEKNPLKVIEQDWFTVIIQEYEGLIAAVIATMPLKSASKKAKSFLEEFIDWGITIEYYLSAPQGPLRSS